ncbi:low temperature requirement protein A [Micromonospora purpureochromogenes]|uniref:Low temperature requirement protein LtrA n=1 Tax=Micromonospora purpureochromogenes TaxID=47872 RepID=A0ABX2RFL4_9ACTN|nr:low temperature requirement protein A [Micromonospora purpureochromogenes]NYF54222.1 low temperature requirement protein LtrA [Micromonospora purpureochromogenes]
MDGGGRRTRGWRPGAPGSRTSRLELYYDLVFVFAFLTVTSVTSSRPTASSLIGGLLVLALLWWCWTGFSQLGNAVRTDQGVLPVVGFLTLAATFLLALVMPGAFVDRPGGLNGPLFFAGCYFLVRALQLGVFGPVARGDPARLRRWALLAALPVISTGFLVVAALVPQRLAEGAAQGWIRLALWLAALLTEYVGGVTLGREYWVVVSAGHWAERHALIVLVALGESIIALGFGPKFVTELPLTWEVVIGAVLGIAVASALWWAYFDTLALAVEQALHRAREPVARARLARDAYTYLHLPMITGVILFALGLKDLLAEGADPETPSWGPPLGAYWVAVLWGGVALYLLALAACGLRALRVVRWPPVAGALLLAVLAPLGARLPELVALVALAVVCAATVVTQTVIDGDLRRHVRRVAEEEEHAAEIEHTRWRARHL